MQDKPTEFELITAIALEYFKRHSCDYVVFECGLGGRLDSTNIIDTTVLSVITGIALDHTSILGNTIPEIAAEKAGIIKKETPVLWCGSDESAKEVIERVANENGARLYTVSRESVNIKKQTLEGTSFDFEGQENIEISLLGSYQVENAVNVLTAVEILNELGLQISDDAIYAGLKKAKWHARFELISDTPTVIFDGGHNPQGVCEAVKSVKMYFGDQKLYTITGVMADKDYEFIASKIAQVTEKAFCITPDNPRALNASEYANVFEGLGVCASHYDSISDAVKSAISEAKAEKKAVLCLGSLYMYKDVIDAVNDLTNV